MKEFINIPLLNETGVNATVIVPELSLEMARECGTFLRRFALVPEQVHSSEVAEVTQKVTFRRPKADALVTFDPLLPIGVVTADCVPVLIYAPDVNGVAAVHAGWKGTLSGIVDNTLDVLQQHGASCAEMRVVFGPSITAEHYEVDDELAGKFVEAGFGDYVSYPDRDGGKPHLDLQGMNVRRLLRRGVPESNITPYGLSTFDARNAKGEFLFPSYRRDKGTESRLLSTIMLTGER